MTVRSRTSARVRNTESFDHGKVVIIYSAPTILASNGFTTSSAVRVSVALGVTYLVMMIAWLSIVDRTGSGVGG